MHRFLIDGYNLLHQVEELAPHKHEELEDQRERLIRRLVAFSADRKIKFQLVFDTSRTPNESTSYPGVQVVFASPSADEYIREYVSNNAGNRSLTVVSSDRKDIGNFTKTSGIEWLTSGQFWRLMESQKASRTYDTQTRKDGGKAPSEWSAEDDDWLRRKLSE